MDRLRVRDLAGSINKCYSLQSKRLESEPIKAPDKSTGEPSPIKPRLKSPRKRSIREVHRSEGYECEKQEDASDNKDITVNVLAQSTSPMPSVAEVHDEPDVKRRLLDVGEYKEFKSDAVKPAVEADTLKELMFQVIILYSIRG